MQIKFATENAHEFDNNKPALALALTGCLRVPARHVGRV